MGDIKKIGLLVLNASGDKFLVCEKDKKDVTSDYLMPGGQLEEQGDLACLRREIREELNCAINFDTVQYLGLYEDIAAGFTDRLVKIKLYSGELIGQPVASSEIKHLHWIGRSDAENQRVSPIIRKKIIPDLIKRDILK